MKIDVVDTLHQPEYTGKNRCEPCTLLNLFIAAVLGSAVARKSKLAGAVAFGVSIALIYLRGYLVPGTPTLTKRYLPPEVLTWFGKDPEPELASGFGGGAPTTPASETADSSTHAVSSGADEAAENGSLADDTDETGDADASDDVADTSDEGVAAGDELEVFFVEQGILEPCEDADDLCLTDEFESAWAAETDPLVDSEITAEMVAEAFGISTDDGQDLELVARDDAQILQADSTWLGQWPSRAALIADIAASRVLQSDVVGWDAYDPEEKGPILNGLRMFLETCPTTGGDIQMGEETVESCCSSHKVIAVTCEDSGERLFEHQLPDAEA
ncbi:hypothetical protein C440_06082 [Haloferax mucosum ATCC BAA-1512]|uniref:Uncharacterized protein n=1 Tax=Haloferax mucosum ATCC BAA-1512 TaxID=662479 RepID=M0IGC3_9EURY|nr:hypothetical protein [Haloferax mucosum]ELZ95835.1 hypothetical protein C440_06082 [Haloferax mucosum ATCC BAA-1512]